MLGEGGGATGEGQSDSPTTTCIVHCGGYGGSEILLKSRIQPQVSFITFAHSSTLDIENPPISSTETPLLDEDHIYPHHPHFPSLEQSSCQVRTINTPNRVTSNQATVKVIRLSREVILLSRVTNLLRASTVNNHRIKTTVVHHLHNILLSKDTIRISVRLQERTVLDHRSTAGSSMGRQVDNMASTMRVILKANQDTSKCFTIPFDLVVISICTDLLP